MKKIVLILDGHLRSALTAVRSLGEQGYTIVCGSHRRTGLALFSRYTSHRFHYPSPLASLEGFRKAIAAVVQQYDHPLIYTFSDATHLALAREHDSSENVEIAFDKRRTVALGQQLGIPVPPTFDEPISAGMPVVIKPRHTVAWMADRGVKSDVHIAQSLKEAERIRDTMTQQTGEAPFFQTYIPATEYGVSVLCDHGRIVAHSVHRRIRSLSPTGGASAVRMTVDAPSGMYESAEKLMAHLAWHGPAMIEFRVGTADRVPYLVEINGRFWGSLALARFAGVDFPFLYAQLMAGQSVQTAKYRRGVYARYWLGDLAHLLRARSWNALKGFIFYGGPEHYEDTCSWSDPLPALMDVIDKIY